MTSDKICNVQDIEELRGVLSEGGHSVSCAKCCATSDDAQQLCEPVYKKGKNLFCDPRL
jgi:hypothetical protein